MVPATASCTGKWLPNSKRRIFCIQEIESETWRSMNDVNDRICSSAPCRCDPVCPSHVSQLRALEALNICNLISDMTSQRPPKTLTELSTCNAFDFAEAVMFNFWCRSCFHESTSTEPSAKPQNRRIRPDQQVVQTLHAMVDEWRPAGICMNVIGHHQTDTSGNGSAGADAADVDEMQDEVITEHRDELDCYKQMFSCIDGAHPSLTEAFLSQVR